VTHCGGAQRFGMGRTVLGFPKPELGMTQALMPLAAQSSSACAQAAAGSMINAASTDSGSAAMQAYAFRPPISAAFGFTG
jgi:hypothetical protein